MERALLELEPDTLLPQFPTLRIGRKYTETVVLDWLGRDFHFFFLNSFVRSVASLAQLSTR